MPKTFACPNCAAPLDYEGGRDLTITCPYCHSSVIVPEELRVDTPATFTLSNLPTMIGQSQNLAEMARLIRAGKKIEAIKMYRQIFGVGLEDAKDAVEKMERGEPVQLVNVNVPQVEITPPAKSISGVTCLTLVFALIPVFIAGIILFATFGSDLAMTIGLGQPAALPTRLATPTFAPTPTRAPTITPTPQMASIASQFGSAGTQPGFFNDARSLALDGAGNIYVADYQGGRVQAFDASGKFLTQWNAGNARTLIFGLAASRQGIVYVVADGEIKKYEGATGKALGALSYPGGNKFASMAVTGDGNVYAMWYEARTGLITSIEGHREDLVRFDAEGNVKQIFRGIISSQSGYPELDAQIAVDGLGNLFLVASNAEHYVFTFSADGKFVNKFGTRGDQPGQMSSPKAIALDARGRLFIADSSTVHVFESSGQFVDRFKVNGVIGQMAFNDKNELLAIARDRVLKFVLNSKGNAP
jgi:outer membrane protein assembly factor BamB